MLGRWFSSLYSILYPPLALLLSWSSLAKVRPSTRRQSSRDKIITTNSGALDTVGLDTACPGDPPGRVLSLLLEHAQYSAELRALFLSFFAGSVSPYLGPNYGDNTPHSWSSFMTDDGGPVELSWDWGNESTLPKVRYSIETYTPWSERLQSLSRRAFHSVVVKSMPGVRLEWFDYLSSQFIRKEPIQVESERHTSQVFYAFDLDRDGVTAKAYFFPAFAAIASGKSTWRTTTETILSAPHCREANLHALKCLGDFINGTVHPLRIEMLAIDLVAVDQARFKIYFRSPSTTLRSVLDTMTLHGRLYRGKVPDGLKELRNLWYDLFGLRDEEPLATMEHRTAGILYYADFCLGDVFPSVKVYLPVRHYASDDRKVLGALRKAMERRDQAQKYTDYENVIMEAFLPDAIENDRGIHTYIGCALDSRGALRLISYINPLKDKMNSW